VWLEVEKAQIRPAITLVQNRAGSQKANSGDTIGSFIIAG
jgi:hypothetical protein